MARVELALVDPGAEQLWKSGLALADELNARLGNDWSLIGGLMVQLHVNRYGDGSARPTDDVDVLGDSRKRPSATERIAEMLKSLRFELDKPTGIEMETAYRFTRGDEVVDVLGVDGTRKPPKTLGQFETIKVKGGTQALRRTETVIVVLNGKKTLVRCPTLLGAILLKARVITSPQRDQDREDLVRLLLCVEDPTGLAGELTKKERGSLRRVSKHLALDDESGDLRAIFAADQIATARVTYNLLVRD